MSKIAVLGVVLDNPQGSQEQFNQTVSQYKNIVKGRMGIPYEEAGVSVISIVVVGSLDEINSLTGKLGNIKGVTVKTSLSKKEV